MWDLSGRIVTNGTRIYYLPSQRMLPPLRWLPEDQCFTYLDGDSKEDVAVRSTLENLASKTHSPMRVSVAHRAPGEDTRTTSAAIVDSVPCRALYGVLPIGASLSVLLYVTESERVATLQLGPRGHAIYVVQRMEWMRLPSTPVRGRPGRPEADSEGEEERKGAAAEPVSSDDAETTQSGGEEAESHTRDATLSDYLRLVDQFCLSAGRGAAGERDASCLYYSPTIDLSLNPRELLLAGRRVGDASMGPSETTVRDLLASSRLPDSTHSTTESEETIPQTSVDIFSWNERLRGPFRLPSVSELEHKARLWLRHVVLPRGTGIDRRHSTDSLAHPTRGRSPGGSTTPPHDSACDWEAVCLGGPETMGLPSPVVPCTSSKLYLASFVRGAAAEETEGPVRLLLLTRLSCQWAGTRYNRRGLEPNHSGVAANMAVTSLWMSTSSSSASGEGNRVAVVDLLRGSIPRRWEQPADLSFKPPIKISPPSNAVDELRTHLRAVRVVLPGLRHLLCLDTTSTSRLEEPLSEAFALAVRRWKEEEGHSARRNSLREESESTTLQYLKFNVSRLLRHMGYDEMRVSLLHFLQLALRDERGGGGTEAAGASTGSLGELDFTQCHMDASPAGDEDGAGSNDAATWHLDHQQSVYLRVNCLDCLDRTNLVQSMIALAFLPSMLRYVCPGATPREGGRDVVDVSPHVRRLFVVQGVALSRLYAGTEPHFVSLLLKGNRALRAQASEGGIAIRRWYQQSFRDGLKQDAVSLLTQQHDPRLLDSEIESPFSRDLSSMNWQVVYGLAFGLFPLLFSAVVWAFARDADAGQLHVALMGGWILYFGALYRKLIRYRVTYTNRPLLSYSGWYGRNGKL